MKNRNYVLHVNRENGILRGLKRMAKFINEIGNRYGRLVVKKRIGKNKWRQITWECLCDCGVKVVVCGSDLRNGHTKSCGCLQQERARENNTTHGFCGIKEYKTWWNMRLRCTDENNISYQYYGGRGIKVCKRWQKFENFFEDMGEKPTGLTIERINNNKDYSKENCCWATYTEQIKNQRIRKTNKTGVKGIYWHKKSKRYQAYIGINYKKIHLGSFKSIKAATAARKTAENEYWNIPETINLKGGIANA